MGLLKGGGDLLGGILNTVISAIQRKKARKKDGSPGATDSIHIDPKAGIEISSTKLLNIGGSATLWPIAIGVIADQGPTKMSLCLLGIAAFYTVAMTLINKWGERKG